MAFNVNDITEIKLIFKDNNLIYTYNLLYYMYYFSRLRAFSFSKF